MSKPPKKPSIRGAPDASLRLYPKPLASLDLTGKKVSVVGGTDGLGRALARAMAARGAEVSVVGRTFRDADDSSGPRVSFARADLSSMAEATRVGGELPLDLDVLVLTTGIFASPTREVTTEGVERDIAISYLSRVAIVQAFLPRLGARDGGAKRLRVFVMGFPGTGEIGTGLDDFNAERAYDAVKVHMNTVAGNEALVLDAVARYPDVVFVGLNPGLIRTNIRANYLGEGSLKHRLAEILIGLFTTSPEKYAERLVPVLFAPELEERSGAMIGAKGQPILRSPGMDQARVEGIMSASRALLARAAAKRDPSPVKAPQRTP